jgi:hypothetical protein
MRFGLALCVQALQNSVEDNKLFFTAMNKINETGLSALHDISQKHVIAELNLKARRQATDLTDYNTALKLFQYYGISFLGGDCWTADYKLSIELCDAAAETALRLNKLSENFFTQTKLECFDEELNCKENM